MDIEKVMNDAQNWATSVIHEAQNTLTAHIDSGELFNSLKSRVRERRDGSITVSFTLPRYGVFLEKGAGRGYGGAKGSSWYRKGDTSKRIKTNPKSLGKMDSGNRKAYPFLNPAIDLKLPDLERTISTSYAQLLTNTFAKIQ